MSMMVYTGTSSRYIAIAAPDLMEWVPNSEGSNPKVLLPIAFAADLRAVMASELETWKVFPLSSNVLTKESAEYDLVRDTRCTTLAQLFTGQRIGSAAACIVIVSFRLSFFWSSNVIDKKSH